jgi:hypothetical protein
MISGELRYYAQYLPQHLKIVEVIPISDVHYGNSLYSEKHFKRTIKYIQDNEHAYTLLNGDLCESVIKSSKGEIFHQVGTPQDQRDYITELLYPIREKILGCTQGNHERRISNETGIDICKDIAKELHTPYRAEGMLVKVNFGDNNNRTKGSPYVYWIYFTHGYGGARTASAKAVKVERTSTFIHADCYLMSHDHVANIAQVVYLVPDKRAIKTGDFYTGSIHAHKKILIKTSAYVKWGSYAEAGGFSPNSLETPVIKLAGTGKPVVRVEL